MPIKYITRMLVGVILLALIGLIYLFVANRQQPTIQNSGEPTVLQSDKNEIQEERNALTIDRLKAMEDAISNLEDTVKDQQDAITNNKADQKKNSATIEASLVDDSILSSAFTKGSLFTTTSTTYTPMNVFTNIVCKTQCTLWIDFYTITKNDTTNNENTYGVFINGKDQALYTHIKIPSANGAFPVSLSGAIPLAAGTYTVEVQSKTNAGTLTSETSFLKVLAIKR